MPTAVKFLHPGAPWTARADSGAAPWATARHTRRFLQVEGRYLRAPGGQAEAGSYGFWGEYEAPTCFRRLTAQPDEGAPEFIHTPVPLAAVRRPSGALNTDPLVVGPQWLYSNCRQRSQPRLRALQRGDLVIFGSLVKRAYVVDTVFVIGQAMPHDAARERLPKHAHDLVLDLVGAGEYTLYIGATYDSPVDGMFSFVPAAPVLERRLGFARPAAPPMLQSEQAMGVKYLGDPQGHWAAVAAAVLGSGLCLGVDAALPGPPILSI